MKNYAITGSTGVLGSEFVRRNPPSSAFDGDIQDADQVSSWVRSLEKPEAILHFAAMVPKQVVDRDPRKAFHVNVVGTVNLLEAIRTSHLAGSDAPWFFYASTSHVYASSNEPVDEQHELNPFTLYGLTKLQGEQWSTSYAREFQLPVCIGRIFSFSHPNQSEHFFLPAMIKRIREAEANSVLKTSGVNGYRDFLRVSQICQAIEHLTDSGLEGPVNIGTGKEIQLSTLIMKIAQRLGRDDLELEFTGSHGESLICDNSKLCSSGVPMQCELDTLIDEMLA